MNKPKASTVTSLQKTPQDQMDDGDVVDSGDEEFSLFLKDFEDGDNYQVSLYRSLAGRASGSYLFQYRLGDRTLSEVMDELRDSYGGGEFRAFVSDGRKRVANKRIDVEAPSKKVDAFGRALPAVVDVPESRGTTQLDVMLASIREDAKQARDDARHANDRTNTMMMKMIESLGRPAQSSNGTSATEIIGLITALNGMQGKDKGGGVKETLELLMTAKTILGDSSDGGGSNIIDSLVKAASPVLEKMAEAGAFNAMVAAPSSATIANDNAKEVSSGATAKDDTASMMRMMCRAAMNNKEPLPYAEISVDQFGEGMMRMICVDDGNFNSFLQSIPEKIRVAHIEWFQSFRLMVIGILDGEDVFDDDDTDGEAGDVVAGAKVNDTETVSDS